MEDNSNNNVRKNFKEDFISRVKDTKGSRWVRFGLVSLLFFLWVIWMGNAWLLLAWLLLLDIYILGYVPWGWWKNKKGFTKTVMGWVDAIVYALILVYFIFAFIGQNYNIPSSSLEKSLLVGDYLWVNKTLYGPRVPQTPLHFPLAQNTILGGKSYIDKPSLAYHRLPGIRSIERGDIVVFNYPCGDTVCTKISNPDYYHIVYALRKEGVENPQAFIRRNPSKFGDVIWRPVDRRDNYVKRAIGLPGEFIEIKEDIVYINDKPLKEPTNVQFNYLFQVNNDIPLEVWQELGVRMEDHGGAANVDSEGVKYYNVPLTREMKQRVEKLPQFIGPMFLEREVADWDEQEPVFPLEYNYGWTRPDMGKIWIPKRGSTLHLTTANLPVYERAIQVYEGNDLKVKDGKIYINGEETEYYTFKMDYYWMMGDNRDRSLDSRYWGFVPEDHVVGSPMFVIVSLDEERGLTDGKIRWNRILKNANPDKHLWQ